MQKWLSHLCWHKLVLGNWSLLVLWFWVAVRMKIPLVCQFKFISYSVSVIWISLKKFPKKLHLPVVQVKDRIHWPDWKSISFGLLDTSFLASWGFKEMLKQLHYLTILQYHLKVSYHLISCFFWDMNCVSWYGVWSRGNGYCNLHVLCFPCGLSERNIKFKVGLGNMEISFVCMKRN